MIVEDEAIIALDIKRRLIQAGFAVTGRAQSGEQALREIERDRPDIVLMDIRLKGDMDGVQTAEIIRNRYGLPVIYLTSNSDHATVDRALATEPFGYLMKPLIDASLRVTLTVALRKHRMECEIQNSRRLLSAILHGVPEGVLVADPLGKVLFLNRTAEEMTGWRLHEAAGKSLIEVAPILDHEGQIVSPRLLHKVGAAGTSIRIPRGSTLLMRDGKRVDITGQLSVATVGSDNVGLFVTLQDVSSHKREDQRLRQEQQMLIAGELAQDVARELFGLFGLIHDAASGVLNSGEKEDLDLIRKASQAGTNMSQQLLELKEGLEAVHAVSVRQNLLSSQSLLRRVCGQNIQLEISAAPALGYVLSTGNHFEQLLVNLVLEGCRRVEGQGNLLLVADLHTQPGCSWQLDSYVRLSVRAEKSLEALSESPALLGSELPGLELAIVHAIAISAQGFTNVRKASDSVSFIEVFLPRYESPRMATSATSRYSQTIFLVGLPAGMSEPLKRGLGENLLFLEAADPDEARRIAQLYEADIDLVIWDETLFSSEARGRACERMHARRPDLLFLRILVGEEVTKAAFLDIEQRVKEALHR
jgi:PAS domain S-box-containing protein